MGQRQLSLKGDSTIWRGVTRLSSNDRGDRHFTKLENCYISSDGSEIRHFPGYATLLDLTDINNSQGYSQYQIDTLRPLAKTVVLSPPSIQSNYISDNRTIVGTPNDQQIHYSRCKPAHVWAFEQINNEIVLIGESRFREDPVYPSPYTSPNDVLTVASVVIASGILNVTLSADIGGTGSNDASVRPFNFLYENQSVFIDGVTVADEELQTELDARVNGRVHRVPSTWVTGSATVGLTTTTALTDRTVAATAGELHHIRYARFGKGSYDPSTPLTPYHKEYLKRPDDPDALTVWRVRQPVDLFDAETQNAYPCVRSEVCNRQRDWGDNDTSGAGSRGAVEGSIVEGSPNVTPTPNMRVGISRREQRKLPYRPHIECASDRIVLAVPQYGCMFQIPMRAPVITEGWTTPLDATYNGISAIANDIFDRPRSLGIPKARLVESSADSQDPSPWTATPSSPFYSSSIYTVGTPVLPSTGVNPTPGRGMNAGTYKVAISFEDPGTGEEGLASEPMTVTLATHINPPGHGAGSYATTLFINYIHPGYMFPECAAWKVNVYLAKTDQEALAFYGQYDLQRFPRLSSHGGSESALYGLQPATPNDPNILVNRLALPMPVGPSPDIDGMLDPTRLAPQSATMPRGASVAKMIRGVLFAGGALGNAGPDLQLWKSTASSRWQLGNPTVSPNDQLWLRTHTQMGDTNRQGIAFGYLDNLQDGYGRDTNLGIAGRCFPDAYQGIDFINNTGLYPGRDAYKKIDRVLNRIAFGEREWAETPGGGTTPYTTRYMHIERLKLERPAFDHHYTVGQTVSTPNVINTGHPIYYEMPRGQLQIGDPGAPHRSSRAFIKIVDANKGDDITAIGQVGGSAIVCTRKETFSYSWYVAPSSSQPNLLSNEFGCISSNSMVEFDGGLAWLSERGPVAMGSGLQYVGARVGEDFYSNERRYIRDSRGMMRHSWGAHDAARGLVIWGLITRDGTQRITDEGGTFNATDTVSINPANLNQPDDWGDQLLSRFPCDEMLIWNYRVNAFSTWRPPAGMEVYWMRPIRDANGSVRMAFLAADQRIYVLNDEYGDANGVIAGSTTTTVEGAVNSTTLELSASGWQDGDTMGVGNGRNWALFFRQGALVEFLDERGNVVAETTIASVTQTEPTSIVELGAAQSWTAGQTVRIGARQRATIVSNFIGSGTDKMSVSAVGMRYRLFPNPTDGSSANVRVSGYKSDDGTYSGEDARIVNFTREGEWESLGFPASGSTMPAEIEQLGRRKTFSEGRADAEELAIKIELSGERQTRIQDILLDVDA